MPLGADVVVTDVDDVDRAAAMARGVSAVSRHPAGFSSDSCRRASADAHARPWRWRRPSVTAAMRDRANRDAGRTIAHSVTTGLETGARYVASADVCLGAGRTEIEAIAFERPSTSNSARIAQ